MKAKRIPLLPLVTLLAWVAAASAVANLSQQNWDVDGLHGGVRVNAMLVNSPCSLATESEEQEIALGAVPRWQVAKPGSLSEPVRFHLILEDCMVGDVLRAVEYGDNVTWTPGQPSVLMNFIGTEEPGSPELFQLHGEAKGVALRLEDSDHHQIHPGELTRPQILNPGRNDLVFEAQLSRTGKPLVEGEFRTLVNVGLEYH